MDVTFCSIIDEAASQLPEKPLFLFPETRWRPGEAISYGELPPKAGAVARILSDCTSGGDRVLLLFPSGPAFWEAFVGCLAAGVIAVPMNLPNLNRPSDLLAGVCRDCNPSALVTDSKTAELLAKRSEKHEYLRDIPVVTSDMWATESERFVFDIDPETTAFLQYTSGSTSRPKGVQISHHNLIANARFIRDRMGIQTNQDSAVTWLPHYHDMGLIGSYLGPLYTRNTTWCLPPEEFVLRPQRWLQLISEHQTTICGGPDFGYRICAERISEDQLDGVDLSSWRVAYIGAEKIRPETMERFVEKFAPYGFREDAFFPCYGLGEATLMATGGPATARPVVKTVRTSALMHGDVEPTEVKDESTRLAGSGQVFEGCAVAIVEPGTTNRLVDDQIGEVHISGPSVTKGYYGRPDLNDNLFTELGPAGQETRFLRTGDLGFLSAGELFITGRISEMMIIRGRNLYPEDIEETANEAHAALAPGGSVAFSADFDGQAALVIAAELQRTTMKLESPDSVYSSIRQAVVESFGVSPNEILLLRPASIPKTSSGKPRRLAVRESYLDATIKWLFRENS